MKIEIRAGYLEKFILFAFCKFNEENIDKILECCTIRNPAGSKIYMTNEWESPRLIMLNILISDDTETKNALLEILKLLCRQYHSFNPHSEQSYSTMQTKYFDEKRNEYEKYKSSVPEDEWEIFSDFCDETDKFYDKYNVQLKSGEIISKEEISKIGELFTSQADELIGIFLDDAIKNKFFYSIDYHYINKILITSNKTDPIVYPLKTIKRKVWLRKVALGTTEQINLIKPKGYKDVKKLHSHIIKALNSNTCTCCDKVITNKNNAKYQLCDDCDNLKTHINYYFPQKNNAKYTVFTAVMNSLKNKNITLEKNKKDFVANFCSNLLRYETKVPEGKNEIIEILIELIAKAFSIDKEFVSKHIQNKANKS